MKINNVNSLRSDNKSLYRIKKTKGMKAIKRIMEIKEVLFESNDTEILLKGEIKKGHMSFSTEIIINHTQLNKLISELIKINQFFDLTKLFKTEKMYNGETLYSANFSNIFSNKIDLNLLQINTPLRQIRA